MIIGLNAGFGDPLEHEFQGIASYGFQLVRQDLYASQDSTEVPHLISEWVGVPLKPLFLIGGGNMERKNSFNRLEPHELAAWVGDTIDIATYTGLKDYLLEIGNEPDIATAGYSEYPTDFAEAIRQCHEMARAHGYQGPIITGGISNLNERGFAYLAAMMESNLIPTDTIIGFHRYPETGRLHFAPHKGFHSREDEWEMLMDITGVHMVACTEFGYSTFTEKRGHTRTDEEVADSVLWDLNFYEEHEALLAAIYQLNDSQIDEPEGRYGVRTFDGKWKPVAEAVRDAYGK
jgi:hypothetical protein